MFSLLVRLAWEDQMKKEKNTTPWLNSDKERNHLSTVS